MSKARTTENDQDVGRFLAGVKDSEQKADCETLLAMLGEITGEKPRMWGSSIIGFGKYHYVYDSGREGDWPIIGFSPRARNLSIYIMPGFSGFAAQLERLGKHKTGKSCLYINRLADVDPAVLRTIAERSVAEMRRKYPD